MLHYLRGKQAAIYFWVGASSGKPPIALATLTFTIMKKVKPVDDDSFFMQMFVWSLRWILNIKHSFFLASSALGKSLYCLTADSIPAHTLSLADVAFDHATDPTQIDISIKQSNVNVTPFRKGVTLTLGRTRSQLCPVAAMASWKTQR